MAKKKVILLTNDDGIYGPGLEVLRQALSRLGDLYVVVPDQEKSTASHSLTLHKPIRFRELRPRLYILNGTPSDCVRFGILYLLKRKVDLVVSGINSGVNLGEDVIYSGTVAAAVEATMLDIPAFAISRLPGKDPKEFVGGAHFAKKLARLIFKNNLPSDVCLNVNVPGRGKGGDLHPKGVKVTHLGHRVYGKKITIRRDPRGNSYYWLLAKNVLGIPTPGSDVESFDRGYITVTPLQLDWTAHEFLSELERWKL